MSDHLREWTALGEAIADRDMGVFEEALSILREIAEQASRKRELERQTEALDESVS